MLPVLIRIDIIHSKYLFSLLFDELFFCNYLEIIYSLFGNHNYIICECNLEDKVGNPLSRKSHVCA